MTAPVLGDLIHDKRLARLFSAAPLACALQLWVLKIKSEALVQHRLLYGRLLPYGFANNSWSATADDIYAPFGEHLAQIVRLNLYVKSDLCAALLGALSAGQTVSEVSKSLTLSISTALEARFGTTAIPVGDLAYRPVAYLLNRDALEEYAPASPHPSAGAFSASITHLNTAPLFVLGESYDVALTAWAVKFLNKETGLDFGGNDVQRFGDLELLVFPTLDDQERNLMRLEWTDSGSRLTVHLDPIQLPGFDEFHARFCVANGSRIVLSQLTTAVWDSTTRQLGFRFELTGQVHETMDSSELEIYGQPLGEASATLCCRYRIGYFHQVSLQGHVVGTRSGAVKFDWLESTTRPAASMRTQAALSISRLGASFQSVVGARDSDPWVPAERELGALFKRLHPSKSDGRFFQRWSQGDGDGRLQFVEWVKALLAKYQQHQVVIFDPYFESAGLGLLLLYAVPAAEYVVFTSLPKPPKPPIRAHSLLGRLVLQSLTLAERGIQRLRRKWEAKYAGVTPAKSAKATAEVGELETPSQGRLDNLLASCEHNRRQLSPINLRIVGLKHGRLHDRYIIITGKDGLPLAGFNLSNSFQKAAENYPLLATPIPCDVLLDVQTYQSALLHEAATAKTAGDVEPSGLQILFDSKSSVPQRRRYEPLKFLDIAIAGDVLSRWTDQASLRGLSGDGLKAKMRALGLLDEDTLSLPEAAGLRAFFSRETNDHTDFDEHWNVLGDLLAHSSGEATRFKDFDPDTAFLDFLVAFLESTSDRPHDLDGMELIVIDAQILREPIEAILSSGRLPHHFFHPTKYTPLTWSEYFAVKILWRFSPSALLEIVDRSAASLPVDPQQRDATQLAVLSQALSELAMAVEFGIDDTQRESLLDSRNDVLRWFGVNAVEAQIDAGANLDDALTQLSTFTADDQLRSVAWMVLRKAADQKKEVLYRALVTALHAQLPHSVPAHELEIVVNSMRGPVRELGWSEPWLFSDVVQPLLEAGRAKSDDALRIWTCELASLLGSKVTAKSLLFDRKHGGRTTNIAAFLFANSSAAAQIECLKALKAILKVPRRVLQQPLANTSDWTSWNDALVVSMWIFAFTKWAQYYQLLAAVSLPALEELAIDTEALAMKRPEAEWSHGSVQTELWEFLKQANELIMARTNLSNGRS